MRKKLFPAVLIMAFMCVSLCAKSRLSLDGKKVVFIGNSFIYYGGCVQDGNQRHLDEGMFYQICKSHGEHTEVYDCTYGGHYLRDFTKKGCLSQNLHKKVHHHCPGLGTYLLDSVPLNDIDAVFLSEAGADNKLFMDDVKAVMREFSNPKTKFYYLVHTYTYYRQHCNILNRLPELDRMGVTVVPWGEVAYDLTEGLARLKGSKFDYQPTTFIKNNGDRHHPNPLSGYLTALMAYCALTDESAVGQPYDFVEKVMPTKLFVAKHYKECGDTNYPQILASKQEMRRLQKMVDKVLKKTKKQQKQ